MTLTVESSEEISWQRGLLDNSKSHDVCMCLSFKLMISLTVTPTFNKDMQ